MSLVYALVAKSSPDEMRYIGRTDASNPAGRHKDHLNEALKDVDTYKCNWIRKVLSSSDEVLVITVESELTFERSVQQEIFYIAYYRTLGHRLTNATDGGEGAFGYRHTEETKKVMSNVNSGRVLTQEHKDKIRDARQGKPRSEETKQKISLNTTGHTHSEEAKSKMRGPRPAAIGKKRSEETKKRLSENKRKYWEQRRNNPDIIV